MISTNIDVDIIYINYSVNYELDDYNLLKINSNFERDRLMGGSKDCDLYLYAELLEALTRNFNPLCVIVYIWVIT